MKKLIFISFFWVSSLLAVSDKLVKFDHNSHMDNVFKPNNIQCSHCHNFSHEPNSTKMTFNEQARHSIFKISAKQICHECHQSESPKYQNAPHACFTCHSSMEDIRKVKPSNHENLAWKSSHSLEARIDGDSCFNCHTTSQCTKCHLDRNNVELKNHSRNFKFTHSVQARATPERCDACHTKNFCISCHIGKK